MTTITKIDSKFDSHPNNIDTGYTTTGRMEEYPKVGKRFMLTKPGGYFKTSIVTKILEAKFDYVIFETENSTYRIEID